LPDTQDIADQLRLVGESALRHAGQRAQIVAGHVRVLRPVEQEVHTPHGVDRGPSPDAEVPTHERRGALARQLRDELAEQLAVLRVQVLGAERIGELEDLLDLMLARCRDSKGTVC
jgi:hypothetical protein